MKLYTASSYEAMSKEAAENMLQLLSAIEKPLICVASGASPAGMYQALTDRIQNGGIDISNWYFVGLDEWVGMNGTDVGSSRHQLDEQLFYPLNVKEEHICFFDGKAIDKKEECSKIDAYIKLHGSITIAILGIGINGHIAMNEPGTPASLRTHVAAIHPSTQEIGQKYFKEPRNLETGLTVGLATLMEAQHLFLLASGTSKAEGIYKMLHEPISEMFPATVLTNHNSLHIYLDAEAGSLL